MARYRGRYSSSHVGVLPACICVASSGGLVVDEAAGPGAVLGQFVVVAEQAAGLQRQAAAPDAAVESVPQPLEQADLRVDVWLPTGREARPVGRGGCALVRQRGQRLADLVEGEAPCWATLMNETRRSVSRAKRRWPPSVRMAVIRPWAS